MAAHLTKTAALVKGRALRVTRLDSCGRIVYGDDAVGVSEGFISVAFTANTSASDEINVLNANGKTIVYEPAVTSVKGYGTEIAFGEVDPEIFTMITGLELVLDADGNSVGFDVDTKVDLSGQGFALEVWAGAPTDDACEDEGDGTYGYLLLPFLQGGILGDFTIENGAITMTLTGANTEDGNAWGFGPYPVQLNNPTGGGAKVPGPMITPVSTTAALRLMITDVAPPVEVAGSRPLLNPATAAITSITATAGHLTQVVTVAAVPDPTSSVGVWWDFGDDTWDYVLGGDTTHTYAEPGTYTVKGSTNGVWRTTTVTVPGT